MIGSLILYFVIMAGLPPFLQWRLFAIIDVKYFKTIKITKCAFLFRGIGGKHLVGGDVKKDGVIIPMFVLQVFGYVIAIMSNSIFLILYLVMQVSDVVVVITQSSIIGFEVLLCGIVIVTCIVISKRRKRQDDESSLNQK